MIGSFFRPTTPLQAEVQYNPHTGNIEERKRSLFSRTVQRFKNFFSSASKRSKQAKEKFSKALKSYDIFHRGLSPSKVESKTDLRTRLSRNRQLVSFLQEVLPKKDSVSVEFLRAGTDVLQDIRRGEVIPENIVQLNKQYVSMVANGKETRELWQKKAGFFNRVQGVNNPTAAEVPESLPPAAQHRIAKRMELLLLQSFSRKHSELHPVQPGGQPGQEAGQLRASVGELSEIPAFRGGTHYADTQWVDEARAMPLSGEASSHKAALPYASTEWMEKSQKQAIQEEIDHFGKGEKVDFSLSKQLLHREENILEGFRENLSGTDIYAKASLSQKTEWVGEIRAGMRESVWKDAGTSPKRLEQGWHGLLQQKTDQLRASLSLASLPVASAPAQEVPA